MRIATKKHIIISQSCRTRVHMGERAAPPRLENMTTFALAAHTLRMYEMLFWEACERNEWKLVDENEAEVSPHTLTKTLMAMLEEGPHRGHDESGPIPTPKVRKPRQKPVAQRVRTPAAHNRADDGKFDPKYLKKIEMNGVKLDLPYLPDLIDYTKCCQGIKVCGGLFSPCLTRVKNTDFCKPCQKLQDQGMADGTLEDRMEATMGDFVSKKTGKSEISYATYLGKRGFTIDDINVFFQDKFGHEFQIPDDPFYTSFSVNKLRKLKLPPKFTPPALDHTSDNEDDSTDESDDENEEDNQQRAENEDSDNESDDEISPMLAQDEPPSPPPPPPVEEEHSVSDTEDDEVVEYTPRTKKRKSLLTSPKTKSATKRAKKEVYDEYHDDESGITSFSYDEHHYIRDPENSVFLLNKNGNPISAAGSWDPISNTIMFKDNFEEEYEEHKKKGEF